MSILNTSTSSAIDKAPPPGHHPGPHDPEAARGTSWSCHGGRAQCSATTKYIQTHPPASQLYSETRFRPPRIRPRRLRLEAYHFLTPDTPQQSRRSKGIEPDRRLAEFRSLDHLVNRSPTTEIPETSELFTNRYSGEPKICIISKDFMYRDSVITRSATPSETLVRQVDNCQNLNLILLRAPGAF